MKNYNGYPLFIDVEDQELRIRNIANCCVNIMEDVEPADIVEQFTKDYLYKCGIITREDKAKVVQKVAEQYIDRLNEKKGKIL